MQNSPDDKASCPLDFSYRWFGNSYSVRSDVGEDIEDRIFLGSAGVRKLKNLCEGQDMCDHTTCEYQKELIGALSASTATFDPKIPVKNIQ